MVDVLMNSWFIQPIGKSQFLDALDVPYSMFHEWCQLLKTINGYFIELNENTRIWSNAQFRAINPNHHIVFG